MVANSLPGEVRAVGRPAVEFAKDALVRLVRPLLLVVLGNLQVEQQGQGDALPEVEPVAVEGALTIEEGAEITLNERKYQVDRGVITFLEERRIFPSFDLQLSTTASKYDVTDRKSVV